MSQTRSLPGFGITLGSTLVFLCIATLLPLGALAYKASSLEPEQFWRIVTDRRALATYQFTLSAAAIATGFNLVSGVWVAWILERYEFPGRRFLDAIVDLPFALPTAVAGISLAALTAPNGWIGQFFAPHDIKIAYAMPGVVLAMTFTSFPFVVRSVQPVLADLDPVFEEAAATLGCGPFRVFRKAVLPSIFPAILSGVGMSFVRSIGEFGAVVFIAGNIPFRTEITSLLIFTRINEREYDRAAALATVILVFALLLLLLVNIWQRLLNRRLAEG